MVCHGVSWRELGVKWGVEGHPAKMLDLPVLKNDECSNEGALALASGAP
jgi:hypothetical protein